ncbi:hypothetical protein HJFPF1_10399 [Paramyrothecium foliicola]|nr:hypothetical protein HJFPF1_10399 [Paramyrothecium foliicola]
MPPPARFDHRTEPTLLTMEDRDHNTFKEVHYPPYAEFMTEGSVQVAPERSPNAAPEVQYPTSPEYYAGDHHKEAVRKSQLTEPTASPMPTAVPVSLADKTPSVQEAGTRETKRKCNLSRKAWLIIAAIALVAVIAIIVGAVVGSRNNGNDTDNSEDETTSPSPSQTSSTSTPVSSSTPTAISTPTAADVSVGTSFSSSFTFYGSNDEGGSQNCSVSRMPCGFHSNPGFTASVSENLFGAFELGENSISCGTCWRLDAEFDASDRVLNKTIVVMVNNICPAQGNPICGQRTLQEENEWGGVVDFNLCSDSGAADALFGRGSGIGLAVGRATRVDCDEWEGSTVES